MASSISDGGAQLASELPKQFGPYHILKRLGRGGMGTVSLARDSRLNREVALKISHGDDLSSRIVPAFPARGASSGGAATSQPVPRLCM